MKGNRVSMSPKEGWLRLKEKETFNINGADGANKVESKLKYPQKKRRRSKMLITPHLNYSFSVLSKLYT